MDVCGSVFFFSHLPGDLKKLELVLRAIGHLGALRWRFFWAQKLPPPTPWDSLRDNDGHDDALISGDNAKLFQENTPNGKRFKCCVCWMCACMVPSE